MFGRRSRARPDPYEDAAGRLEAARRAEEVGDTGPPPPDVPMPPRPPLKWIAVIFLVLGLFAVLRSSTSATAPKLAANCDTFAVKLSTGTVAKNGVVRYTIVGPRSATVRLVVDVVGFRTGVGGRSVPQPAPGRTVAHTQVASDARTLTGCRYSGYFAVIVPPGRHTVNLLQMAPDGSGRLVASALFTNRS